MHSLKLIHLDIKPSNIAYSTEFQKYIFIDFGLSIFVN
jgi:serine/threonine protein kinase